MLLLHVVYISTTFGAVSFVALFPVVSSGYVLTLVRNGKKNHLQTYRGYATSTLRIFDVRASSSDPSSVVSPSNMRLRE